ncbi:MAG: hypothetical protein CMJ48_10670, partial [Planctomycetaceae bacterium]|nr:hypothetical protein [Planctomycetaceae bacterium]
MLCVMEKIEIALDGRTTGPIELADEEFLRAIVWKRSAPKRIRTAAASGDVEEFLHQWRISLGQRVRGDAQGSGVSWSQAGVDVGKRTDDLVALIEVLSESGRTRGSRKGRRGKSSSGRSRTGNKERLLVNWLEDVRPHGGLSPLEVLALLEVLGQLDVRLSTEALWIVWRRVFEEVIATSAAPAEGDVSSGEFLLAAGELPYLAGLLFDGVKGAGKLSKQGRRVLRDALIEQTDTDGTPDAELVDRLAAWLAPLIRATAAAKRFETELWNGEDVVRFELLIEVAAAMCAPDGKLALSNGSCREPLSMLLCGTEYSGMSKSRPARAYLQSIARRRGGDGETRRGRDKAAITPVSQSDWAQLACMRSDWSRAADTLVVAHHRVKPWIDLTAGGRRLLSGAWDLEISIDGTFVELCDDWECVCWYS